MQEPHTRVSVLARWCDDKHILIYWKLNLEHSPEYGSQICQTATIESENRRRTKPSSISSVGPSTCLQWLLKSCAVLHATPDSHLTTLTGCSNCQIKHLAPLEESKPLPQLRVMNNGPVFPLLATLPCGKAARTATAQNHVWPPRYLVKRAQPPWAEQGPHSSFRPLKQALRSVSRGTTRSRTPQPIGPVAVGCQTYFSFLPLLRKHR